MGGIANRGDCPKHLCDHPIDSLFVLEHIVIGEPQHLDASTTHILVPCRITLRVDMGPAIHLDHQLGVHAGKISVVGTNRLLAPKMPALCTEMPENPPHCPFRAGLVEAQ